MDAPRPPVLTIVHRYPNGTARIEDGPPISTALADRLGEYGDEITATHSGEEIRYGRRRKNKCRRAPSKPQRRYLNERDRCCQFPGCGQRKRRHAHHVRYYSNDGETIGSNLVLLCPRHHGAIHRRGWTITGNPNRDDGDPSDRSDRSDRSTGVVFLNPDGRAAPTPADTPGDPTRITAVNEATGIETKPDTIIPRGRGERYDHELTIWITTNYPNPRQPRDQ